MLNKVCQTVTNNVIISLQSLVTFSNSVDMRMFEIYQRIFIMFSRQQKIDKKNDIPRYINSQLLLLLKGRVLSIKCISIDQNNLNK